MYKLQTDIPCVTKFFAYTFLKIYTHVYINKDKYINIAGNVEIYDCPYTIVKELAEINLNGENPRIAFRSTKEYAHACGHIQRDLFNIINLSYIWSRFIYSMLCGTRPLQRIDIRAKISPLCDFKRY